MNVKLSQPRYFKDEETKCWSFTYRMTLPNGKIQNKTVRGTRKKWKKKQDAIDYYNQLLRESGIHGDYITFGIAAEHYAKQYEKKNSTASYLRLIQVIKNLCEAFSDADLNKLAPIYIQDYFTSIYDDCSGSELTKRFRYMKAIHRHAQQFYNVKNNPFEFLEAPVKKAKPLTEDDFWSIEEFKTVMSKIEEDLQTAAMERNRNSYENEKYLITLMERTVVYTLFWTGTRLGEFIPLLTSDLYKKDETWYLSINKTQTKAEVGHEIKDGTKTESGVREIAIHQKLVDVLQQNIAEHKLIESYKEDNAPLISIYGDKPIHRNRVERILHKYTKRSDGKPSKTEVKYINPHRMRHSHGSVLLNDGEDIAIVSKRLGHADIQTTMKHYVRIYNRRMNEVVSRIDVIDN